MGEILLRILFIVVFTAVLVVVAGILLMIWVVKMCVFYTDFTSTESPRVRRIKDRILSVSGFMIVIGTPILWLVVLYGPVGKVNQVETSYISSSYHSEAEIKQAMRRVKATFRSDFGGCTLTDLWYDEDCLDLEAYWQAQYDGEEVLILMSNLDTGKSPEEKALEPNTTYTDWQWILVKKFGIWTVEAWG